MHIKSFEQACEALKIGTDIPAFPLLDEAEARAQIAHYKLTVIAKALNEGWKPDWTDSEEYKYYPYFDMDPDTFSLDDVDGDCYRSYVSSRLCFKSRELARYAATQFLDLYKDYYLVA